MSIDFVGNYDHNVSYPNMLIDNFLESNTLALMYGDSNAGKTFVAISLAGAIAQGKPWLGRETIQGCVIYMALEAPASVRKRIKYYAIHHKIEMKALGKFVLSDDLKDLTGPTAEENISLIKQKAGVPILLIIDTFSALFSGDENSSNAMGAAISLLKDLQKKLGCTVLVVHHTGKPIITDKGKIIPSKGPRGHSSLRAAMDTCIYLSGGDQGITIEGDKAREFPREAMGCSGQLITVDAGTDERGNKLRSCAFVAEETETARDEFAHLLQSGLSQRAIAKEMHVNEKTVRRLLKKAATVAN